MLRRGGKFYASCSSKKSDAKLDKGPSWVPCDRTVERVLQMVHDRLGGHAARGKGAVLLETPACWSREGSEL